MIASLHFGARAYNLGHLSFIYFYKQHSDCTENFSTLSFQPHQYNLRLAVLLLLRVVIFRTRLSAT